MTSLPAVHSSNARLRARKRLIVVLAHTRRILNRLVAAALARCARNATRFVMPTDAR
jgi:hypothetical protein